MNIYQSKDLLVIRRIFRACFPGERWHIDSTARFWVLEEGGAPVGYVALEPNKFVPGEAYLSSIAVMPPASGRGHAVRLLRHVVSWARAESDYSAIVTYVVADNGPSLASFFKAGWRVYWPDEWMVGDAVYFRKALR